MKITCYGSSSKGNCYLLDIGNAQLLLDAGVKKKELMQSGVRPSSIDGILITHSHGDHSSAVKDYVKDLTPIYILEQTFSALGLNKSHYIKYVEAFQPFFIKDVRILPFEVEHDVPCVGYCISSGGENLVFTTDAGFIDYCFKNVTHFLIEANHDFSVLQNAYRKGDISLSEYTHIQNGHLSISQAVEIVKKSNNPALQAVMLIHLSERHADPDEFVKTMQSETGVPTYVMSKGGVYIG